MIGPVRPELVARIVEVLRRDYGFGDVSGEQQELMGQATADELLATARVLRERAVAHLREAGMLRAPRSLLDLTFHELIEEGARGHAKLWLADQLGPSWASRPGTNLSTVLKTERIERVRWIATRLRKVGIHDLDELAMPD